MNLLTTVLRGVAMLAVGVLVLGVAAVLLVFTLAFVLFAWVRGVLFGRRPTWQSSWVHVQRSAASSLWETYQRQYRRTRGNSAAPGGGPSARPPGEDVVDVAYREVPTASGPRNSTAPRLDDDRSA